MRYHHGLGEGSVRVVEVGAMVVMVVVVAVVMVAVLGLAIDSSGKP